MHLWREFCFPWKRYIKIFSVSVLISVMTASVTADCVASAFLGRDPVFQFQIQGDLPMQYFWMVLLLGLVLGVFGGFL